MQVEKTIKLSKFQQKFLEMADEPIVILTTGVGAGKSRVAALWTVFEAIKKKTRIIAAAQNYRALTEVLFREIEKVLIELKIQYHYNKGIKFVLQNGSEIFGATAQNPTSILGFTDIECAVIDEAAYCPEELYNYITDRMRGENITQGKIRLLSSPSSLSQFRWFRNICEKYKDKVIRATTFDNPFTSQEYKQSQIDKYEKDSPLYRQQLLGLFIDEDIANSIISNDDYPKEFKGRAGIRRMGIDCSGAGCDYNVFTVVDDNGIVEIVKEQVADTFKLTNIASELVKKYSIETVNIDNSGGFGQGLYDMLKIKQPRCNVNQINFGQAAKNKDVYGNCRAEMYFNLVDRIKSGFYVDDEEIKNELSYTSYVITNAGKTILVPKKTIKELIGHSPDKSDSLALACYEVSDPIYRSPTESLNIALRFVGI